MTTSARELLEQAADDCHRLRAPNTEEARLLLNTFFEAAGLPTIENEKITAIRFSAKSLEVETYYSVRSCDMDNLYEIPISIIDAPDPLRAARHFKLRTQRDECLWKRQEIERTLHELTAKLPQVIQALAESEAALAAFNCDNSRDLGSLPAIDKSGEALEGPAP